ncbi:MAG: zinc ribbon domain-containing protein [Clostridia bacterium]|nr:zinc ribbon domain-containing protein [Clostridia bacterium]
MLCEKCGTENKEGTSYCKKCGEDLFEEKASPVITEEASETVEVKTEEVIKEEPVKVAEEKKEERVRTSPLAVRMQEKSLKEDKKIRKKLKRGKMWAAVALLLLVMLVAENSVIILDKMGYFGDREEVIQEDEPVKETVVIPEVTFLNSEALEGGWTYSYSLKKNWDADASGDYETVTEVITSSGEASLYDEGGNHMSAMIIPGEMIVDGAPVMLGNTPEAFSAWYEEGYMCIQMKGTEQKFFAAGGAEPLVIKIPVSMDSEGVVSGGTYSHTYDKVVTEMSMRYEIDITFEKK